ncbi:MAG TPA: S9 family peptidase, partial [Gemmatimonadales bacterium]|nr:S9 family peptidase [Gemmatimonadales bacterium]
MRTGTVPGAGIRYVPAQPTPPQPPRRPHVVPLHGDSREDEYFWMRDRSDPEVVRYLEAENAYAEQMLAHTRPLQARLYDEMLGRIKQTDLSVPYREGEYLYYARTEEGKQYPIYCRKRGSLEAAEEVILDLNALAEGRSFLALGAFTVSDDGNLLAYSTDTTGFRDYVLHVKDLRTGTLLAFRVERVSSVAWAADDRTLFYVTEDEAKRPYRLHRHTLGRGDDPLLFEEADGMFRLHVTRTRSRRLLLLYSASHTTSEARWLEADRPEGEWRLVAPRVHEQEYEVEHHGERLLIRVNDTGRNFRLVEAPLASPDRPAWREILPHQEDVMLEGIDAFAGHLAVYQRRGGLPEIRILDLAGGGSHYVTFPEPAYEVSPSANPEWETTRLRYSYQSLVTPASVFEYDMVARRSVLLKQTEVLGGYDPARYVSERLHAPAPDGTPIPISLVRRRDVAVDGRAPLLLHGYGAYAVPYPVTFSSNRLSLLDRGVVVAIAHVRGGGELGRPWHDAGRMLNKLNTFTDFIAAAEYLLERGYGAPDRLVIEGGSAGGLLMGAVTNLRPELFRAVVSHVPFVDVLNTMLDESLPLTVGEYEEWGNPRNPDEYASMRRYSPYDNLRPGPYPAMLVRTSFNDSQVMYWEPAKYVARLRALKTDRNPLLLITNMGAGHTGASGRYDRLREVALDYAFILDQLGL